MADRQAKPNSIETLVDRPLIQPPEGADGMGPTLGQDVSVEEKRRKDARHGAHPKDRGPEV